MKSQHISKIQPYSTPCFNRPVHRSISIFFALCLGLGLEIQSPAAAQDDASVVVLDDGDSGTQALGNWRISYYKARKPYNGDVHYSKSSASYTWTPSLAPGQYKVSMWWTVRSDLALRAPVTIQTIQGPVLKKVNQSRNGGRWNLLGTFELDTGAFVRLNTTMNRDVCADAVMFELVKAPPSPPTTTSEPPQPPPADTTAPAAPAGLQANVVGTAVNLNWDDNLEPDLDHYSVYRSTASGGNYELVGDGLKASAFLDSNVLENVPYFYVVTTSDATGNVSDASSEVSAQVPSSDLAPSAPAGLTAAPGQGSVSLNWNDNPEPDLSHYTVYRSLTSGEGYQLLVDGLAASEHVDTAVTDSTTYFYAVTAVDATGNVSPASSEVSAQMPTPDEPPSAPTGLLAAAGQMSIDLDWNDSPEPDLSHYSVYRSLTSGEGYQLLIDGLAASEHVDTAVADSTTYFYVVTAVDAKGNVSPASPEVSAQLPDLPPSAPTGLKATASPGKISLDWNDNPEKDLASYSVFRSTTPGKGYSLLAGGLTASSHIDTTVAESMTYYYVVTAVDAKGSVSPASSEVSAKASDLPPSAPKGLLASAGTGSVGLDWNDNPEPDLATYSVFRSTTSGSGYSLLAGGLTASDYTDASAVPGTVYYYVVKAVDKVGNVSSASGEASAAAKPIVSGPVTLSWTKPTVNKDGTPLTDLAGFKLYRGTVSGTYSSVIDVGNITQYTLSSLPKGAHYFCTTSYDLKGNESDRSNEVMMVVQ